jgi:site-specific recombinase XerD
MELRHAPAAYIFVRGTDLQVVTEVLGHSQIYAAANIYRHVRIETTRITAEHFNALNSR